MTNNNITLSVDERYRIDRFYKLYFSDQLLLAVPDLDEALFIACDDQPTLNENITASEFIFVLVTFVQG